MLPFGPRLNTVFASRWKALLWAGGVLLTAYCAVPAADSVTDKASEQPVHKNPWALDPESPQRRGPQAAITTPGRH